MLQFSGTLRGANVKFAPLSFWLLRNLQPVAYCSGATAANPILAPEPIKKKAAQDVRSKTRNTENAKPMGAITKSVIQSLNKDIMNEVHVPADTKIKAAKTVEDLLIIVNDPFLTRENAFVVVTQLFEMVKDNRAKLNEFETDMRFLRLRSMLKGVTPKSQNTGPKVAKHFLDKVDLFCGIHGIDDAGTQVPNLTIAQMMEVLRKLSSQKQRPTPLLRSLAYNISRSQESLTLKQLSDILYSMSVLNYADEVLLQRICNDLTPLVKEMKKPSAPLCSIITSLGMLHYKNEELMDAIADVVVQNISGMRPQDLTAFFLALATLGHRPANVAQVATTLQEGDMAKASQWLVTVWAFTVLGIAEERHLASVLNTNFIQLLANFGEILPPAGLKLLNINGAAQLLFDNYNGPLLDSNSKMFDITIPPSKEKQSYAWSVTSTLASIFPAPEYLLTNVNTRMGFQLDAEFLIDKAGERLPVKSDAKPVNGHRVAVFAQTYHDICLGKRDPLGCYDLRSRLMKAKGYEILSIPHYEFNTEERVVNRIAYLKDRLKAIVT